MVCPQSASKLKGRLSGQKLDRFQVLRLSYSALASQEMSSLLNEHLPVMSEAPRFSTRCSYPVFAVCRRTTALSLAQPLLPGLVRIEG